MPRMNVKRKNSVLRTLVGNAGIDKAFKHVYDKIDDLLPDIATIGSPVLPREAPIGKTLLAQNDAGQNVIAIRTEKGWETDINAKLSVVSDARNFRTSSGLNSLTRKPVEGESLKYNQEGYLVTYNKLIVNNTLTTRSNAIIGGDLTVSGGDIYGPSTDTDLTIRSNKAINFQIDNDNDESGLRYVFTHNNGTDILCSIGDTGYLTCSGTMLIGTIAEVGSDTDKILMSDSGIVKYVTGANLRSYIGAGTGDSNIAFSGSTANGLCTYGDANTINVENTMSFDSGILNIVHATATLKLWANVNDYATLAVADTGDLTIATVGDGTTDSDLTLDADGSIILDAASGNFIARKAGTEFSASSSAYAGMILGYTCIGADVADDAYTLTTSYICFQDSGGAEIRTTFKTPPSEQVEIEVELYYSAGGGASDLLLSISDNATYTSNSLAHQSQFEKSVSTPARGNGGTITQKFFLGATHLASVGSANILYIAAGADSTSGTPIIKWGGNASGEYTNLVMKATALPVLIVTGS